MHHSTFRSLALSTIGPFFCILLMTHAAMTVAYADDSASVTADQTGAQAEQVSIVAQEAQGAIAPQAQQEQPTQDEAAVQAGNVAAGATARQAETKQIQGKWVRKSAGWQYMVGSSAARGFISDAGKTYFLDEKTGIMKTGWQKVNNDWYFFTSSGAMRTGWLKRGSWYYLDPKDGKMLVGKHVIDKATYYFGPSGAMKTGWVKDGSDWYFFTSSGAMKTGWIKRGAWYYLDPAQQGKMRTGRYQDRSDGVWYISNDSGAMYANKWVKLPEGWYFATSSGALKSGWKLSGGKWYWLQGDKQGLMIANATKTISGDLYSFDGDGAMRANCQVRLDGNACGYAASSGAISSIGTFSGDKVILKDAKGKVLTGWQKLAGKWFYADKDGVMQTGWVEDAGKRYWLASDGVMAAETWVDGGKYYAGRDGAVHLSSNKRASDRLVAAAQSTPYQGNGYCAKWVDQVYINAGYSHFDGHARDFYWQKCTISDLNKIEPGMVIGVPSHTRSSLGSIYGHVAIYMGNGMVRHNTSRLETVSLSSWLSYYQTTYAAKCGWGY